MNWPHKSAHFYPNDKNGDVWVWVAVLGGKEEKGEVDAAVGAVLQEVGQG